MEGLQTIKCFGSSKAFSAKMQAVQGVYGVKTFVRRHGVEVLYDPAATDTLKIQAAIFAPTLRKYAMPGEQVPVLDVVKLGVEGLHDRMDMIYFGMVLQKIEGVYGFTSEFACPVDVTVYVDPAAGITEKMFGEAIDAKELIIPAKEGEKVIPMHTVLKTYAVAGQVSREEFAQVMFRDVEKLAGRFVANLEKWGDDEQFPKAVRDGIPRHREDADPQCVPLFQELPFVYGRHRVRGFRPAGYETRDAYPLCEVDVGRREAVERGFPDRKMDAAHG